MCVWRSGGYGHNTYTSVNEASLNGPSFSSVGPTIYFLKAYNDIVETVNLFWACFDKITPKIGNYCPSKFEN